MEDEAYIRDIEKLGFSAAYLDELQVLHAGGPFYAAEAPEKQRYWEEFARLYARKRRVKRLLLRIPFVPSLNQHFGWFTPPEDS